MTHFAYPWAFAALLLPFVVWYILPAAKGLHGDALRVPFLKDLARINLKSGSIWGGMSSDTVKLTSPLWLGTYLVYALLITALARPQWAGEPVRIHNFSRDILLVMDISTSMEEPDFVLNNRPVSRLNAVKKVAGEFIDKRGEDRIGLNRDRKRTRQLRMDRSGRISQTPARHESSPDSRKRIRRR